MLPTRVRLRPMPLRPFVVVTATLSLLLMLGVPAAHADTNVELNFDALPADTVIGTQFAAQGVTFVHGATASGLPVVANVGAAAHTPPNVARSRCVGIGNECEFAPHSVRANFSSTTSTVSIRAGSGCSTPATVTLQAHAPNNSILDTASAVVGETITTQLTVNDSVGMSRIAYVRIFDNTPGCFINFDTFTFVLPATPPPPDFTLSATSTILDVRQGSSATIDIGITRFNNSNGNIDFSTSGLPASVTTSFTPNPAPGASSTTQMTLTADPIASPTPGLVQITIIGDPANAEVGPFFQMLGLFLRIRPNFALPVLPVVEVPSCSTIAQPMFVTRAAGFGGAVAFTPSGLPTGFTTTITPPTSGVPTDGSLGTSHDLRIGFNGTGSLGSHLLTITGTSPGLPSVTENVVVRRVRGAITGVSPTAAFAPRWARPGDAVTITGTGLCPGTTFRFGGAPNATVTPPASAYNSERTAVTVNVPRLATSGFVTATNADGTLGSTASLTVHTARGVEGSSSRTTTTRATASTIWR